MIVSGPTHVSCLLMTGPMISLIDQAVGKIYGETLCLMRLYHDGRVSIACPAISAPRVTRTLLLYSHQTTVRALLCRTFSYSRCESEVIVQFRKQNERHLSVSGKITRRDVMTLD